VRIRRRIRTSHDGSGAPRGALDRKRVHRPKAGRNEE